MKMAGGITPIGIDHSVCVSSGDSTSIVYLQMGVSLCATCEYGCSSCVHVQYFQSTIAEVYHEEIPLFFLKHFVDKQPTYSQISIENKRHSSCISQRRIPFALPSEIMALFKVGFLDRFQMDKTTQVIS